MSNITKEEPGCRHLLITPSKMIAGDGEKRQKQNQKPVQIISCCDYVSKALGHFPQGEIKIKLLDWLGVFPRDS